MFDFESVRPIASGLIGGIISIFLLCKLAKRAPRVFGDKQAEELVQENRTKILIANILFFSGIAGGLLLYLYGYFEPDDWRGLALAFGLATVSPVVFLFFVSIGQSSLLAKEAFLAYAISQRIPLAAC